MESLFLLSRNPRIARKGMCLSHLEQKSLFAIKLFSLQRHGVKPDAKVALEEKSVWRSGLGRNLGIETFSRQAGSRTVMLTWVEVTSAERPEQLRIWSWKKESLFITLAKLHVIILHALHLKRVDVNLWAGCKVPKERSQDFCTSFRVIRFRFTPDIRTLVKLEQRAEGCPMRRTDFISFPFGT